MEIPPLGGDTPQNYSSRLSEQDLPQAWVSCMGELNQSLLKNLGF